MVSEIRRVMDERLAKMGINKKDFAKRAGITYETLRQVLLTGAEKTKPETLNLIEDAAGWHHGFLRKIRERTSARAVGRVARERLLQERVARLDKELFGQVERFVRFLENQEDV